MKRIFLFLLIGITVSTTVEAQNEKRKKIYNLNGSSIAIEGYDPVAYFNQNKAVQGKKEIALVHEGVTYYFSSPQNKGLFIANPFAYRPQYGGWCAYAMGATGENVNIDPETFKITGGKLYLFYNKFFNNTLKSWNKNEAALRTKADANWTRILQ